MGSKTKIRERTYPVEGTNKTRGRPILNVAPVASFGVGIFTPVCTPIRKYRNAPAKSRRELSRPPLSGSGGRAEVVRVCGLRFELLLKLQLFIHDSGVIGQNSAMLFK